MTTQGKRTIVTDQAPAAIGPYSAGVTFGSFVFTSGQLGLDPLTNSLVEGGIQNRNQTGTEKPPGSSDGSEFMP